MKTLVRLTLFIGLLSPALLAQGADVPVAITVAPDGYVFVTGTSMSAAGQMEYLTVAYDPTGRLQGSARLPGSAAGASIPAAMALAGDRIIVTGTSPTAATGYDIVTVSYNRSTLVSTESPGAPPSFTLSQSYPNPVGSGGVATIRFTLPSSGQVRLNVVDLAGREVSVLAEGDRPAGSYEVHFRPGTLPAGTYFYVLQSSNQNQVRKLAVLR